MEITLLLTPKQLLGFLSEEDKSELRALFDKADLEARTGAKQVTIKQWLKENEVKPRLFNCLWIYASSHDNPLVGEVDEEEAMRQRNFGRKTWAEFIKIRGY